MFKSIKETALPITEGEYRNDGNMHYSTLSTFRREGFNKLDTLFDRKESPSLTFGSAVDSIITGGLDEFNDRFIVIDLPKISDTAKQMATHLFNLYSRTYTTIDNMPIDVLVNTWDTYDNRKSWGDQAKAEHVVKDCSAYYSALYLSKGKQTKDILTGEITIEPDKTILSNKDYNDVLEAVKALKTSEATSFYFQKDNPIDGIERQYQLKWKAEFNNIGYSSMMDLIVIDNINKTIQPVDLKTSSHYEWDFWQSFLDWGYWIQANQYATILKANMEMDDYFKDFKILPYKFIVVNRKTLTPLVWTWHHQFIDKDIKCTYKGNDYIITDFRNIGQELNYYLNASPKVPVGVVNDNNIDDFIKFENV